MFYGFLTERMNIRKKAKAKSVSRASQWERVRYQIKEGRRPGHVEFSELL